MGGDADFEHARLWKIHTSIVVSARSVMGFSGSGPLVYLIIPPIARQRGGRSGLFVF